MKKIKLSFSVFLSLFLLFSVYSLYPVLTYKADIKNEPGRIYITDRFGEVITDKQKSSGYYKSIQINLDSLFVKSLLSIEDKDFYTHFGIDIKSKLRAFLSNLKASQVVSGGSTITEQYIKNKYFMEQNRTYMQKAREAYLSFFFTISLFQREYPKNEGGGLWKSNKNQILINYLDSAYFGNQIYGIGGALEVYFGKDDLNDLTEEEIVILISLLHNPSVKSLNEKYFSEYFDRVKSRLGYDFERTITKLNKKENIDKFPFVTSRVMEHLKDKKETVSKSTIDANLQEFSKSMLNETLDSIKGKNVTNGAFVLYNPKTFEVLAYEGSRDFYSEDVDGEVDVIRSARQMGSTLKPFLYLQALNSGVNPDDFVVDLENKYNSFKEGKVYISENYSLKEYGLVRFKKAIGNSLNNASVRLAQEIGLEKVWGFFKDYGLDLNYPPEHYGYSMVLGNPSISLENLVLSYRNLLPKYEVDNDRELRFLIIPNNFQSPHPNPLPKGEGIEGEQNDNPFVATSLPLGQVKEGVFARLSGSGSEVEIEGGQNILERGTTDPDKYLLYDILSNPDNRDISFGVNSILNTSIPQAVKTGTSSEFRDNVIVSYHPDLIVGIWIGNNDNSSMIGVSGITGAGYLWHQIVEKAINMGIIGNFDYDKPKSIEKATYCLDINCLRQEIIYKKIGKEYKSAIIDNKYFAQDIFEKLSIEEKKRLKDLKFNIIN
ncbi:MAG: transglycosylase domain-containing protein [Candidatus Gracilibacteria bacterium]|nr:transglycosylase domain-containing protein [Candidatus Gracilibacteria bacterium]